MIKTYKNISVFKKEVSDDPKKPTHDISVSAKLPDGTYEKSVNVGSMWTKDGAKGKYLSGQFSNAREYQGKVFDGYVLVKEDELKKVLDLAEAMVQKTKSPLKDGYPTEVEVGVPNVSDDWEF